MAVTTLRLGTRASALAMAQSTLVAEDLRARGIRVELVPVRTDGDISRASLTGSGMGVFAGALRAALLDGMCDIAVHSAKDLPVAPTPGLQIAAVPQRADAADVLCSRDGLTLAQLPAGARVGTGSPRRAAQIRRRRPDVQLVDIRGNVGTRLSRLTPDDLDAVVLAMAGLQRLGLTGHVTERLDLLPAPGQGCLAVECAADRSELVSVLADLDDVETRSALTAERALLQVLQAGCSAPIGTLCTVTDGQVSLTAAVFSADGRWQVDVRTCGTAADAATVGRQAGEALLSDGGDLLPGADCDRRDRTARLADFHDDRALWRTAQVRGMRVLLTSAPGELSAQLSAAGACVEATAVTRAQLLDGAADQLTQALESAADWLVLTSARTVMCAPALQVPAGTKVAAVGSATARAARRAGLAVDLVPPGAVGGTELAAALPDGPGRVVLPCSQLADPALAQALRDKGWQVQVIALYTMASQDFTFAGFDSYDAVIVTAGSAARALLAVTGIPPAGLPVLCLGPSTARTCASLGITVTAVPPHPDAEHIIRTLAELAPPSSWAPGPERTTQP